MGGRNFLYLFLLPAMSLLLFQNCAKQQFSVIDSQRKTETLESHGGLAEPTSQEDTGTNGNGGPDQNDGGLGQGMNNPPSTNDMGLGGGVLGPGGMVMTGGPNQNDGGINNGGGTPVGGNAGTNGGPSTPDGGTFNTPNAFNIMGDAITNPTNGRFNVIRWCRGKDRAATLREARSIQIEIVDKRDKSVICRGEGQSLLQQILDDGMVDIPGCDFSMVPNDKLIVRVVNQNGETLSDGTDNGDDDNAYDDGRIATDDNRQLGQATALHLLYDRDIDRGNQADKCDAYNGSPLVVDMRRSIELEEIFEMTAPSFGVVFDILGNNSYPSAFRKKKISWFKDPRIMPIVLPSAGSEIGINELFGDNTLGPDGEFATDGFAALAKYDGRNMQSGQRENPDGYITSDDAIFSELRLWYDRNLDGIADPGELISLERARVEVIDLRYDPSYYSRDRFGNEIKYKSVVKLSNDQYKPVFDVWFVIDNRVQ